MGTQEIIMFFTNKSQTVIIIEFVKDFDKKATKRRKNRKR